MSYFVTLSGNNLINIDSIEEINILNRYIIFKRTPNHDGRDFSARHYSEDDIGIIVKTINDRQNKEDNEKQDNIKLKQEVSELKQQMMELSMQLKYMPPNYQGGPGYQTAKQDFESYQKN